jgi:pimeloyl-ACP methyl ester carboxylesterase/uncharacterized protein YndB with AHSA1/START domain
VSTLEPSRPLERGHAPVNGIDMYYEVHGRQDGVPLVLLHGGGSTIEVTFGRVLPVFAARRRVIALEEQGHGRTTDRDAPVTFESSADDVAALLRHLQVDGADLLGFSNGASVALQVALRHPQLVRKLVFASSMTRRAGAPQLWPFIEHADFSSMPQPLKDAFLQVNPDPTRLRTMHDKDLERMRRFEDVPDATLRAVRAPTLIVLGDQDIVSPEHAVELTRLIPAARLLILPGGHGDYLGEAVMTRKPTRLPELTAQLIEEFLEPDPGRPLPDVHHVSVHIARSPAEVYAFASDPRNLPRWAAGLARSEVRRDGDAWIADAPFGKVRVRFAERNSYGVMDHEVTLESGVRVHNPMRVLAHEGGSQLVFTLIRQPGMSDRQLAADEAAVENDLKTLKNLLERQIREERLPMPTGTVRLHRVLRTTPDKVYRAFLDPDAMVKWLPPHGFTGKVHHLDARVGGTYRMSFTSFGSGHSHAFGGTYLELVPDERIKHTDRFDDPNLPGEMQTTVVLQKVSVGTEVSIVQEGIPEAIPTEACYLGWQESLLLLAQLVEADIPG